MAVEPSVNVGRVGDILTRFSCCSLTEQLQLLRTLPSLVSVDFISFLPSLAVVKVLGLLSVQEVTNCLRVSRSWYRSISDCKEYWLEVCRSAGLNNVLIEYHLLEYSGSTKSVALAAWSHYKEIITACSAHHPQLHLMSAHQPQLHLMSAHQPQLYNTGIPYVSNIFYAGKGNQIIVRKEKIERRKFFTDSFKSIGMHYVMTGKARILWAHSCDTKIVCATNSASWGILYDGGGSQFWDDRVVLDLVSEHIGEACNKCGMVACITKSLYQLKFNIRLVCLHPGCSTVDAQEHVCGVVNQIAVTEASFLHLESTSFVSSCGNAADSDSSLCYEHHLLIQVGGTITIFGHQHGTGRSLEQLYQCCPSNNLAALTSAVFLGNRFRLSEDQCLVAMTSSNMLCVWDLRNRSILCEVVIPITGPMTYSWRCLAVGHLYAVVCNEDSLDAAIICVLNGQLLQRFKVARHQINAGKLFLVEQGWLDSIDSPVTNKLHFVYTTHVFV